MQKLDVEFGGFFLRRHPHRRQRNDATCKTLARACVHLQAWYGDRPWTTRRSCLMAQRLGPLQTMYHRSLHSMCSPAVSFVLHQPNALAVQKGRPQAARRPCRLTACLARLKTPPSSATRLSRVLCTCVSSLRSGDSATRMLPRERNLRRKPCFFDCSLSSKKHSIWRNRFLLLVFFRDT